MTHSPVTPPKPKPKGSSSAPANPLDWMRNNWNHPAQGVAAFAAAIFSFWQSPLDNIAVGTSNNLLALGRTFVIPIVWLLMSVPARLYRSRRYVRGWVVAAIILFALSLLVWFQQNEKTQLWTVHSSELNKDFIVGTTFTPEVIEGRKLVEFKKYQRKISDQEALEALQKTSPLELIEGAEDNKSENVWNAGEIQGRRRTLSLLYLLGIPLFVMSLIAALQTWYCAGRTGK